MTKHDNLVADPEFAKLLIPLTPDEHQWLEESLKREGCRDPLVAWRHNAKLILLDGHNRKEICENHGISYKVVEVELESREAAKIWIRKNQLARRNLPDDARAMLAARLLADMRKLALSERGRAARRAVKARHPVKPDMLTTVVNKSGKKNNLADVAKDGKVSQRRVRLAQALEKKAVDVMGEAAAQKVCDEISQGRLSLVQARRDIFKAETLAKLEAAASVVRPDIETCDLRCCSMQELLGQVRDADCIICDPPYSASALPLYSELARLSVSALKPDGLMVVMTGQSSMPQALLAMSEYVRYLWTMAYLTLGSEARIWSLAINVQWKPVLLFSPSGTRKQKWMCDVVKSDASDKRFADWGQSESGMMRLIERLTEPNDLIVDPFLGGGTTAVAALRLHRRIIGCDVDADMVKTARRRVALEMADAAASEPLFDGKEMRPN